MTTVAMNCPNEECEADYEVTVRVYGKHRRASMSEPADEPELDVEGPDACASCGEPLDTPSELRYAIAKATESWTEAALEHQLEHGRALR